MGRGPFAGLTGAVLAALAIGACAGQSPVTPSATPRSALPSATPDAVDGPTPLAQPVPGLYELTFVTTTGEPVSRLPVGDELVLWAHVEDGTGDDALRGSVIFQVCT